MISLWEVVSHSNSYRYSFLVLPWWLGFRPGWIGSISNRHFWIKTVRDLDKSSWWFDLVLLCKYLWNLLCRLSIIWGLRYWCLCRYKGSLIYRGLEMFYQYMILLHGNKPSPKSYTKRQQRSWQATNRSTDRIAQKEES